MNKEKMSGTIDVVMPRTYNKSGVSVFRKFIAVPRAIVIERRMKTLLILLRVFSSKAFIKKRETLLNLCFFNPTVPINV
ncbi:hypothetical protein [Methanosarcina siciliae]|uniref:hypothetical protein n=1 Tax=Methanosarcina siciliae TaxID=38027 RepID=UPI0021C2576A|nr:hypothetical protein [Methanosarcina siciliae]